MRIISFHLIYSFDFQEWPIACWKWMTITENDIDGKGIFFMTVPFLVTDYLSIFLSTSFIVWKKMI